MNQHQSTDVIIPSVESPRRCCFKRRINNTLRSLSNTVIYKRIRQSFLSALLLSCVSSFRIWGYKLLKVFNLRVASGFDQCSMMMDENPHVKMGNYVVRPEDFIS